MAVGGGQAGGGGIPLGVPASTDGVDGFMKEGALVSAGAGGAMVATDAGGISSAVGAGT